MSENNPASTPAASPSDANNQEPKTNNQEPITNNPPPIPGADAPGYNVAPLSGLRQLITHHSSLITSPSSLPEIASAISSMLRTADHVPLAIGRFLAETYYDNSRHLFSSRKRKRFSLRALTRLLREQCALTRSSSSLRQMIAAHFQEPDLALSADESARLTWRARVELLRVHDPAEKSRLARECVAQKWTKREMHYRCRGLCTPVMAPQTKGERLLRSALRLCRELEDWKNAPPYDVTRIREVILRINQDFSRVHTDVLRASRPSEFPASRKFSDPPQSRSSIHPSNFILHTSEPGATLSATPRAGQKVCTPAPDSRSPAPDSPRDLKCAPPEWFDPNNPLPGPHYLDLTLEHPWFGPDGLPITREKWVKIHSGIFMGECTAQFSDPKESPRDCLRRLGLW